MDKLVDYAALKQPVEFSDLFNSIMVDKAAERLEDFKQNIAQGLYSDDEDYGDVNDDSDDEDDSDIFSDLDSLYAELDNDLGDDEYEDS